MGKLRRRALGSFAVVALALAAPAAAGAAPNPLISWSAALPGVTDDYTPGTASLCSSGDVSCVSATLAEMNRRLAPLAQSCDHNALFSLLYTRITDHYLGAVSSDPNYFSDNAFVNREDAVFGSYYFHAFDAYQQGNRAAVPGAWQIAFDAAAAHQLSGTGDILLGVNAHIQRDLPFVLYRIGLVKPDGSSRKPDHDKVNQILYGAYADAISETAQRFDPSVNTNLPAALSTLGYSSFFQAVEVWRESAWRNAEQLAIAPDDAARAAVARQIEGSATTQAALIRASTAYVPLVQSSASRDAYCAVHHA